MILAVAFLEWMLGLTHFAWCPLSLSSGLATTAALILVAAANEELIFRGYPFQRLVESFGAVGAVVLSSAVFGLGHLANPDHTWISGANSILAGILLAIAYLRTRGLWMPLGIHFMWNYVQGVVLGLPVSGYYFRGFLKPRVSGAAWLTGAGYGPEGGVLATAAVGAGIIYVLFSKQTNMSEEMRALVFGSIPAGDLQRKDESPAPTVNGPSAKADLN